MFPTDILFYVNSLLFGLGLAMDAFSVSLANGLNEPNMKKGKTCGVAGVFAFYQALMPMIGYILVRTIASYFSFFEKLIPWIALALLGYIGGKMLYEGIKSRNSCSIEKTETGFAALMIQGVATSIDALSVGLDMVEYSVFESILCALIIAAVTFVVCMIGLVIGKKVGTCISGWASIFGGAILIFIGLEIFISSWF